MQTVAVGARATSLTAALQLDVGQPAEALATVVKALQWLDSVAPSLIFSGWGGSTTAAHETSMSDGKDESAWQEAARRSAIAAEHVMSLQLLRIEAQWAISDYYPSLELQRAVALASLSPSPARALCGLMSAVPRQRTRGPGDGGVGAGEHVGNASRVSGDHSSNGTVSASTLSSTSGRIGSIGSPTLSDLCAVAESGMAEGTGGIETNQ